MALQDPLLEAINAYKAERDVVFAMPIIDEDRDQAFEAEYEARVTPLFWRMNDPSLLPTTTAGALAALRFLQEENKGGPSALADSLVDAVANFLEGRAA